MRDALTKIFQSEGSTAYLLSPPTIPKNETTNVGEMSAILFLVLLRGAIEELEEISDEQHEIKLAPYYQVKYFMLVSYRLSQIRFKTF